MEFSGPNGKVTMTLATPLNDGVCLMLQSLALFDTSETKHLEINFNSNPASYPPYNTLSPMKDLRTLELYRCKTPDIFIRALDPTNSSSGVVVCPKLEEVIMNYEGTLDVKSVIGMAAARGSSGAELKSLGISSPWGGPNLAQSDVSELEKHVFRLELVSEW